MLSLNKLGLVFLTCGFFTFCDPAATTTREQKSATMGCKSHLHLCCEGKPYNPQRDTCCKTDGNSTGNLTVGLSERMSQCCGEMAYNPLNEICCGLKVTPKPSHDAKCCGEEAYNPLHDLCCKKEVKPKSSHDPECCGEGPYDKSKKICCSGKLLDKLSPDHKCCYGKLYDSSIENCCQNMCQKIQMKINNSKVCVKNFTCDDIDPAPVELRSAGNHDNETIKSDKEECKAGNEKEVYNKKNHFQCCGLHHFNPTLWSCKNGKLSPLKNMMSKKEYSSK
ncbi:galaxin-like isoform X1 [Poecilia latipinna]|uniref:galaxin-like isoform X1 n=2 Tax=Poecilia latipinna TaxID=48699 RepID=UPI00072E6696|nr:PREDICTED: galaxin-like isoform X1 [Poecilia latipinna]